MSFLDPYAESPVLPADEQDAIDRAQARALAAQLQPGDDSRSLADRVIDAGASVAGAVVDLAGQAADRVDESIGKAKRPGPATMTAAGAVIGGLLGLPLGPIGGIVGGALGGWLGSTLAEEGK